MTTVPVNATGWSSLMDGHMIEAVYSMFDAAFFNNGFIIVILFLLYQTMLYRKTGNTAVMFIVGVIFASMYGLSIYVEAFSLQIIFLILVLELAGMLIVTFFY